MNRGIIETAIDPAIRLELTYRLSSRLEKVTAGDEEATEGDIATSDSALAEEFACLLNVLRGSDGDRS